MEPKEIYVLKVFIVLREQPTCNRVQAAHMNLETVQVSASHALPASIALRDQFSHNLVLLAHIVLENQKSLRNALSVDMVKQQSFNQAISVQFVLLENIARMELSLEIAQLVSIVIKELILKTKTQSFVQSATTALQVRFIPLFAQQEQLHSKEVEKRFQIAKSARKDSIVLKEVPHSLSVLKDIIAL
jgi:hypothetical protein